MIGAPLFTIGYEKALLPEIVGALAATGVATLLDVPDRPISRRPGFSKQQLAAAVEEAGIGYHHLAALGTPPEGRFAGRRGEFERFWSIVDEKLSRPEAELDLRRAPNSPRRHRRACCATRPIGATATAAASPRSWRAAMASRCAISRSTAPPRQPSIDSLARGQPVEFATEILPQRVDKDAAVRCCVGEKGSSTNGIRDRPDSRRHARLRGRALR